MLRELKEVAGLDEELAELTTRIGEAQVLLGDAAHELRRYTDALSADPDRLATIEDRLHLLSRLLRKHGPDMSSLIAKQKEMQHELSQLVGHEERRRLAGRSVEQAQQLAGRAAERLSVARQQAAAALSAKVERELGDLAMDGAKLLPQLLPRLAIRGDDSALVVASPGAYRIGLHELQRPDSPRFVNIPESDRPVVQLPIGSVARSEG